jgi:hypothetical protein
MGQFAEKARVLRPLIERAVATGDLTDVQKEQATALFPAWDGEGHKYAVNDYVQFEGLLYRCVQAHTSQADWTPTAAVSLWSRASDPTQEWPEWIQPTGAHDAYAQGAKVSHNGKHWVSNVDGNVWEPPTQWTEATQ